jgi:pyruvate dehydrogenase E2 component (dihydrolipoamide acetyltransferase)
MATPVEAPKLGNTVEECIVAKWRMRKGEPVAAGDVVVDIETDKATFEVSAPVAGVLLETFFEEGALVPVFTNLFVIGELGENAELFRPGSVGAPSAAAEKQAVDGKKLEPEVRTSASIAAGAGSPMSPRARRFADEHRFQPPPMTGSGPGGRVLEQDVRDAYYSRTPVSRTSAKPAAVRAAPEPAPAVEKPAVEKPAASPAATMRQRIARRMRESLATTAQYTLHGSADASGILRVRARIKQTAGTPDININDLIAYCTIQALLRMPELNAEFIDGAIVVRPEIHLGFACDTPRGLLVPVIRNAHQLSPEELAVQAKELTARAVQGNISPDDLSGATFTISNLGALGIETFTPLLNPPQVAILGVGAIGVKPVRRGGACEFIDAIGLSLTCDHQVIDGAPGARFLKVLKERIENVESECTI